MNTTPSNRRAAVLLCAVGALLGAALYFGVAPRTSPRRTGTLQGPIPGDTPTSGGSIPVSRPTPTPSPPATSTAEGFSGMVLDPTEKPVSSALVYSFEGDRRFADVATCAATKSDDNGNFTLSARDTRGRTVVVSADGFLPAQVPPEAVGSLLASGQSAKVVLQRGAEVHGLVRDSWGRPVDGAQVEALADFGEDIGLQEQRLPGPKVAGHRRIGMTDSAGRFTVSGLLGLPVRLRASRLGFTFRQRPTLVKDGDSEVVLVLHPLCRLGIRVLDAASGDVVSGGGIVEVIGTTAPLELCDFRLAALPAGCPADGWNEEATEYWMTFAPGKGSHSARDMTSPSISVTVPGYRTTESRPALRWPGEPDFSKAVDVRMEPLRPSALRGILKFHLSWPLEVERKPKRHSLLIFPEEEVK